MSEEERDLLPFNWVKKYGTFITKMKENIVLNAEEESKAFEGRWEQVAGLESLKSDAHKAAVQAMKDANTANPTNADPDLNWDGYMSR